VSQVLQIPDRILDYEALGLIKNGKSRLSYAQGYFTKQGIDLKDPDVRELLVGLYLHWRDLPEYLVFEGEHQYTHAKKWGAGLMSKRGNAIYRKRLRDRLSIVEELPDHTFFKYKDRSRNQKTRALFITLTWAVRECLSCGSPMVEKARICPKCGCGSKKRGLSDSWFGVKVQKIKQRGPGEGEAYGAHGSDCGCISCQYNRYITALREAYGRVSVLRVWEGFESGYPHVHLVALFHDHEFPVFYYEGAWRVQGKQGSSLEAYRGGFTDVEALASLRGGVRYITKYLTKIHGSYAPEGGWTDGSTLSNFMEATTHGDFTMSVMWLFRKRAFSISGDFIEFTTGLRNSKSALMGRPSQVDLEGQKVWVWSLKGFHTGRIPCARALPGVPWSMRLNLMQVREVMASSGYGARETCPGFKRYDRPPLRIWSDEEKAERLELWSKNWRSSVEVSLTPHKEASS